MLFSPSPRSEVPVLDSFPINPSGAAQKGAEAACVLQKPPETTAGERLLLLLETAGNWRPGSAGDLWTTSDAITCNSLAMLKKSNSYASSEQGWILYFRTLLPFPAFRPLVGLSCEQGCWAAGGLGQTLLSCGTLLLSDLLAAFSPCRAHRQQYLVVLFCFFLLWIKESLGLKAKSCILPKAMLALSSA